MFGAGFDICDVSSFIRSRSSKIDDFSIIWQDRTIPPKIFLSVFGNPPIINNLMSLIFLGYYRSIFLRYCSKE